MTTLKINGLRISGRFVRLRQSFADAAGPRPVPIYRKLAADRMNISFLYGNWLGSEKQIGCLVEPERLGRTNARPDADRTGASTAEGAPAGVLSVFPHRFDPAAIAALFSGIRRKDVEWHYLASSGSMLALVIDYECRKKAVAAVSGQMELPASHGPLDSGCEHDFIAQALKTAPETVARYEERKIRTYGIEIRSGLVLCTVYIRPEQTGQAAQIAARAGEVGFRFFYASAARTESGISLELLLEAKNSRGEGAGICQPLFSALAAEGVLFRKDAELIRFHGPHFGDRYGIADKALSVLGQAGVSVWLAGCVGATVSIVIPPGASARAVEALCGVFEVPGANTPGAAGVQE